MYCIVLYCVVLATVIVIVHVLCVCFLSMYCGYVLCICIVCMFCVYDNKHAYLWCLPDTTGGMLQKIIAVTSLSQSG